MSEVLHQVTQAITADDLPRMVLGRTDLPAPLRDFLPARSGFLDNHSLAEQGLPGSTAERFREVGRLTGYLQEFLPAAPEDRKLPPGFLLAAINRGAPVRRHAIGIALDRGGLSAGLRIAARRGDSSGAASAGGGASAIRGLCGRDRRAAGAAEQPGKAPRRQRWWISGWAACWASPTWSRWATTPNNPSRSASAKRWNAVWCRRFWKCLVSFA